MWSLKASRQGEFLLTPIQILNRTCKTLGEAGVEYWLCNGTLLGIIRDGELIPWDNDLDIAVHQGGMRNRVIEALISGGFLLIDDGDGSSYVTFLLDNQKVDINFFELNNHLLESIWKVNRLSGIRGIATRIILKFGFRVPKMNFMWEYEGYSVPREAVFPLTSIQVGQDIYSVPRNSERVLEHTYGKGWRVPKRDYDWRSEGANNVKKSKFDES